MMGNSVPIAVRTLKHFNCQSLMPEGKDKSQEHLVQPLLVTRFAPPWEVCWSEQGAVAGPRQSKAHTSAGFLEQNLWAAIKLEWYDSLFLKQSRGREKEWNRNILEVFLWVIQKTILEKTEHFKQLGLQPRQMVQNEEWESSANKIKLLAMAAPNECAVVVLGASLSVLTLHLKSTHLGLLSWHLSLASSRDLHVPRAGVEAALFLPKRSKCPNENSK